MHSVICMGGATCMLDISGGGCVGHKINSRKIFVRNCMKFTDDCYIGGVSHLIMSLGVSNTIPQDINDEVHHTSVIFQQTQSKDSIFQGYSTPRNSLL